MSDSDPSASITGIVLAGGAGTRMGGADKGLLSLQGRPLIEHVLERLIPQVDEVIILANRNLDSYRDFGHPVVSDALPDYPGPLLGMLAGLTACNSPKALFVCADAPRIPLDLTTRLLAAGIPALATDAQGWQPLFCLLSQSLRPTLETAIEQGERSPRRWLETLNAAPVRFDDDSIWSVNTPEELNALQSNPELAA